MWPAPAHPVQGWGAQPESLQLSPRGFGTHLDSFLRFLSSALAFWAEVRLSASARLSTAIARKTLSRMSEGQLRSLELRWRAVSGTRVLFPRVFQGLNPWGGSFSPELHPMGRYRPRSIVKPSGKLDC